MTAEVAAGEARTRVRARTSRGHADGALGRRGRAGPGGQAHAARSGHAPVSS